MELKFRIKARKSSVHEQYAILELVFIDPLHKQARGWLETVEAKCTFCGEKMQFIEGDIIFGEKWYHHNCAKQVKLETMIPRR